MIATGPLMRHVHAALEALHDHGTEAELSAQLGRVVKELRATLGRDPQVDKDPLAAGWPAELEDEVRRLRQRQWNLCFRLQVLAFQADPEARGELSPELWINARDGLRALQACARREEALGLRAVWLDLEAVEPALPVRRARGR